MPHHALITREETFGPLAPLLRFIDESEVVARANGTECGLAAYFHTRDLGRLFSVAESLDMAWAASIPAPFRLRSRRWEASRLPARQFE